MLPYFDNFVSLDPRRQDRWGVPIPRIQCALHQNERAMLTAQATECADMIEAAGGQVDVEASMLQVKERGRGLFPEAGRISRAVIRWMFPRTLVMGAAIHESGGARMGGDPRNSVLNQYNQSWDVPNLFVTDASSFPTGGSLGTTLTVMALTVRACEYLATELKAGHL
ncbi:MAG: GMC family oxidoreductase [Acetobacter sp.]|nr:GMC family oxidoreductase [Acetobacter sp.]MCI1300515.1 GMC family oxidoreductase [Acetobacter sp.]MCI1316283.1 GMC family oxidoreductase [Acetobacter sp.]